MTIRVHLSASSALGLLAALALTFAAANSAMAGEPCLAGSPLSDVRSGSGVADKTGRAIGRVDSVHCRRGYRDAQVFVRIGRLRDQTIQIFPARALRVVGVSVVVPLSKAQIDATPRHRAPEYRLQSARDD